MKNLDCNEIIREVNKTYQSFEDSLNRRIKSNDEIIQNYKDKQTTLLDNIDYKKNEIEKIKNNSKNYFGGNTQFSLLIEKEKVVKKIEKELEDLNNEHANLELLIHDLEEELIKIQNKNDNNTIDKLHKEKKKIIESIINKQLYDQNVNFLVDQEELKQMIDINDRLTKE